WRRAGAGRGSDVAGVGEGRQQGRRLSRVGDPVGWRAGGEGGGVMVRARGDLRVADRTFSAPFLAEDGRPGAWLEIGGPAEVAVFGAPADLRALAAGANAAADEADELRRVAELLAEAGVGVLAER